VKLNDALTIIEPVDQTKIDEVQSRLNQQAKPPGSLGRLEEFARRYIAIRDRDTILKKAIFTFAGDHGIALEGVSAFPREVTPQMVFNFLNGGAAINALARHAGADLFVVDMGVDHEFEEQPGLIRSKIAPGTANFAVGPAMSRDQAVAALEAGIRLAIRSAEQGFDLVGTGDMGIGNTTPSAAIAAAFTGLPVSEVTHRGTGIDDAALQKKVKLIEQGLRVNSPDASDPVDVLAKVGGFEIGGIAGLIIGCAAVGLPVVVDGFISTAGALIASEMHPQVKDYIFAAHKSVEVGHTAMLERIGQKPMLDLQMRLGEGTGTALAMTLIEASLCGYREIATFGQAEVSEGE
jgi:nicotinate-nucleotide--dimethylbenzimidazole phosphoribosyltransferase